MYGLHTQALTKMEQAIGLLVLTEGEEKKVPEGRERRRQGEGKEEWTGEGKGKGEGEGGGEADLRREGVVRDEEGKGWGEVGLGERERRREAERERRSSRVRMDPTELPMVHVECAMVHHMLAHNRQAILICEASLNKCISAVGDSHLQAWRVSNAK